MNALPNGRAFSPALAPLTAIILIAGAAVAQAFSVSIYFERGGSGYLRNSTGFYQELQRTLAHDVGPGGAESAVTYELLSPPELASGDVLLLDDKGRVRNLVRFNSSGGRAVFYSVNRADTFEPGFPSALYANVVRVVSDQIEGTIYRPKRDEPGFVQGAAGPVTYFFYRRVVWRSNRRWVAKTSFHKEVDPHLRRRDHRFPAAAARRVHRRFAPEPLTPFRMQAAHFCCSAGQ